VITDGWHGYSGLKEAGYRHKTRTRGPDPERGAERPCRLYTRKATNCRNPFFHGLEKPAIAGAGRGACRLYKGKATTQRGSGSSPTGSPDPPG
jgi:hypothetical protein